MKRKQSVVEFKNLRIVHKPISQRFNTISLTSGTLIGGPGPSIIQEMTRIAFKKIRALTKTVPSEDSNNSEWLDLSESAFEFWDNDEDSAYDDL